jgi:hypothetical protein
MSANNWTVNRGNILHYMDAMDQKMILTLGKSYLDNVPMRRQERNLAAANAFAIITKKLLGDNDPATLDQVFKEIVGEKDSGMDAAWETFKVAHPAEYSAAQTAILQNRVAGQVNGAIAKSRVPGPPVNPGGKPSITDPAKVDFSKALGIIEAAKANGEFRSDLEYQAALQSLKTQASVHQTGWVTSVSDRLNKVWSVYDKARASGMGYSAAMNAATASADFAWLQVNQGQAADAARYAMEVRARIASRGAGKPPMTQKQSDLLTAIDSMQNDDSSFLVDMPETTFSALMRMVPPNYERAYRTYRKQAQLAIAKGAIPPKTVTGVFTNVAETYFAEDYRRNVYDKDADQMARFATAKGMLLDWAQEYFERENKLPTNEEIRATAVVYLTQVQGTIGTQWVDRTKAISTFLAGDIKNLQYDTGSSEWEGLLAIKQEWIASRKEALLRRGQGSAADVAFGKQFGLPMNATAAAHKNVLQYYNLMQRAGALPPGPRRSNMEMEANNLLNQAAEDEWNALIRRRPNPRSRGNRALIEGRVDSFQLPGAPEDPQAQVLDEAYSSPSAGESGYSSDVGSDF